MRMMTTTTMMMMMMMMRTMTMTMNCDDDDDDDDDDGDDIFLDDYDDYWWWNVGKSPTGGRRHGRISRKKSAKDIRELIADRFTVQVNPGFRFKHRVNNFRLRRRRKEESNFKIKWDKFISKAPYLFKNNTTQVEIPQELIEAAFEIVKSILFLP